MTRGGKRENAGRPKGRGPHGEATKPIRIPISMLDSVQRLVERKGYQLPVFTSKISAGFPSPADDYQEGMLDLNEHLIQHPAASFILRVSGDSMINAGIFPDDLLIVDRSITPQDGKIVIAILDGELTVKRLSTKGNKVQLMPENPNYQPIDISEEMQFEIWGVVKHVIHSV